MTASKKPLITGSGEPEGHANHFSFSLPERTTLGSKAGHQPHARPGLLAGAMHARAVKSWQSTGVEKTQTERAGKLLLPTLGDPFTTPATIPP